MRRNDRNRPRALAEFEGIWALSRDIVHAGGAPARFTGQARWNPDPAGLQYVETGTLEILGQGQFAAERRYLWDQDLRVFFEDGRFFHQVPPSGGTAAHWCDPDRYDVCYDFTTWPEFSVTWDVSGPRKSYRMVSQYRR